MKRTVAGILLVILILPFVCSFTHTDAFYVNDNAGVLTPTQEASMLSAAEDLANKTKAQVVVLTVQSLGGKDIAECALDTLRDWGIGDQKLNNGVLILLSTGDRDVRIEVGYGLEGCIPDSKAGRLIDTYAIPYYREDDFANGTEQLFYAVLNEVRAEYALDPVSVPSPNDENRVAQESQPEPDPEPTLAEMIGVGVALIALVALIILTKGRILLWIGLGGFGRGGGGGSRNFGGGGSGGGGGAGRRF